MMYSKEKLDASLKLRALTKWLKNQLISEDSFHRAQINPEGLYKNYSLLKRIGLYVLTMIASQSAFSLFGMVALGDMGWKLMSLVIGTGTFFVLRLFIRNNHTYKQGTDDALLHMAVGYIAGGLISILSPDFSGIQLSLTLLLLLGILLVAVYLFADAFLAVLATLVLYFIPLHLVSLASKELLFFSFALLLPLSYIITRLIKRYDALRYHYWHTCFQSVRYTVGVLAYCSINLFVVKTLAYQLMGAEEIPLQTAFLVTTILFPLALLVLGLYYKQKYLLHTGLFLILPTVATIRYYYSVMPIEAALMFGGLLIMAISYFAITLLKRKETAFTFEPDEDEDLSTAETLMLLNQFAPKTIATEEKKIFGGGDFGGGGAEGKF